MYFMLEFFESCNQDSCHGHRSWRILAVNDDCDVELFTDGVGQGASM